MHQEEIERNIAFIVGQQAKFFADIEALKATAKLAEEQAIERGKQIDAGFDRTGRRLDRALRLGVQVFRQEREKRWQMDEEWTSKLNILINAQIRAAEKLDRLSEAQVRADERQAKADAQTELLKQALAEMPQAVGVTNRRIDSLEITNGENSE